MHHMAQPHILQYKVSVLVVHYSLDFITYKAASGGGFLSMWDSKGCGVKDYKAKPLVRGSVHPRIRKFQWYTTPLASQLIRQKVGGFSFDVGLQRMRCKRLQGKALGSKIRTSEDPTLLIIVYLIICFGQLKL